MTQTCTDTSTPTITPPARRRPPAPLPVLIEVPALGSSPRAVRRPARRRRLRREVRVAGIALLAILPMAFTLFTLGADRLPRLRASRLTVERPASGAESESLTASRPPGPISLAPLEPVVTIRRDLDAPVFLPGYLLPADAPEESSDGGH